MAQVCIPSIHKATSSARWLRKADFEAAKKQPRDTRLADIKSRTKHHLHTISRVGSAPMTPKEVKEVIQEHHKITGTIPKEIITPATSINNRGMSVVLKNLGCVHIRFVPGKEWGVR